MELLFNTHTHTHTHTSSLSRSPSKASPESPLCPLLNFCRLPKAKTGRTYHVGEGVSKEQFYLLHVGILINRQVHVGERGGREDLCRQRS